MPHLPHQTTAASSSIPGDNRSNAAAIRVRKRRTCHDKQTTAEPTQRQSQQHGSQSALESPSATPHAYHATAATPYHRGVHPCSDNTGNAPAISAAPATPNHRGVHPVTTAATHQPKKKRESPCLSHQTTAASTRQRTSYIESPSAAPATLNHCGPTSDSRGNAPAIMESPSGAPATPNHRGVHTATIAATRNKVPKCRACVQRRPRRQLRQRACYRVPMYRLARQTAATQRQSRQRAPAIESPSAAPATPNHRGAHPATIAATCNRVP